MHIILSFFPPLLAAHDNSYSHFLFNESAQLYTILSECENNKLFARSFQSQRLRISLFCKYNSRFMALRYTNLAQFHNVKE